jgi:hypothetical protein
MRMRVNPVLLQQNALVVIQTVQGGVGGSKVPAATQFFLQSALESDLTEVWWRVAEVRLAQLDLALLVGNHFGVR